jgi:hypothetical protein
MTRIPGPVEEFAEVQQLIRAKRVYFSTTSRNDLAAKYGGVRQGVTRASAILTTLEPGDYDHSVRLPNPPADADVYGLQCDDEQWYLKFYTDVEFDAPYDSFLSVISFHIEREKKNQLMRRRKVDLP